MPRALWVPAGPYGRIDADTGNLDVPNGRSRGITSGDPIETYPTVTHPTDN
jgi:hypothetical protein